MKKVLVMVMMVLGSIAVYGQKQGNIWWLGGHTGVDFNNGVPQGITFGSTSASSEGITSISDSSGNLLFYSNGQQIMNKNYQIMPNGDSLLGNISSTQSSVIIPKPESNRYFYIFTVDDYWIDNLRYGFRFSVVDNCLDSGLGDVIPTQKNILLLDTVGEKVAAVRHANGIDYWIITHKLYSDAFYCYLLTSNGITDIVITHIGSNHNVVQGQMKISPNGNRLAVAASQSFSPSCHFELFDFDKSSGILSNVIFLIFPTNKDIYGVEFSPDNSKLYASYGGVVSPFGMGIVEYDLDSINQTAINNSMTTIFHETIIATLRGLQLGPNGKIYQVGNIDPTYLLAINSPNNYGALCNVQDSAVYLAGNQGGYGLPTFIANFDYSNTINNCQTTTIYESIPTPPQISLYPNPTSTAVTIHHITSSTPPPFQLLIEDVLGNKIFQQCLTAPDTDIDVSKWSAGVYFYEVRSEKGSTRGKFVKQ